MTSKFAALTTGLTLAISLFSIGAAHAVPAPMRSICSLNQFACADGGRDIVTSTPLLLDLVRNVNRGVTVPVHSTTDILDNQLLKSMYSDCGACGLPSAMDSSFS